MEFGCMNIRPSPTRHRKLWTPHKCLPPMCTEGLSNDPPGAQAHEQLENNGPLRDKIGELVSRIANLAER